MIDVGANIGDTARFVRVQSRIPVLCVEGSRQYLPFLHSNVADVPDVEIEECYLGDAERGGSFEEVAHEGTGHLAHSMGGLPACEITMRRLDDVLTARPRFARSKILKSDTDGFEAKVLRGATEFLTIARPVLFVEYDPQYLEEQGDSGLAMLQHLAALGYAKALVYDAFGTLILGLDLSDWDLMVQIHDYVSPKMPIPYLDVAVFHVDDADLFATCLDRERDTQRVANWTPGHSTHGSSDNNVYGNYS